MIHVALSLFLGFSITFALLYLRPDLDTTKAEWWVASVWLIATACVYSILAEKFL